jgi:hypothetical protein
MENYFTKDAITANYAIPPELDFQFDKFAKLEELIITLNKDKGLSIKYDKVRDAPKIVKLMKKDDIPEFVINIIKAIEDKSKK